MDIKEYKELIKKTSKKSKYNNKKVKFDSKNFDSKKELSRYLELQQLQKDNKISNLKHQAAFDITINNIRICKYIADFTYLNEFSELVVEDVKAFDKKTNKYITTRDFELKRKLMFAVNNIEIKII